MKTLVNIFIFIIISSCDSQKHTSVKFTEDYGVYRYDTLEYTLQNEGNSKKYVFENTIYDYKIDESKIGSTSLSINNQQIDFTFLDSASIYLNDKKRTIYCFQSNSTSLDGSENHYFSSEDGLILIESTVWNNWKSFKNWAPSVTENLFMRNEVERHIDTLNLEIETTK